VSALQVQGCVGSPQEPQGQGFMAASNMKLAGKVSEPLARLIVTT
jgi:hypothetical protein